MSEIALLIIKVVFLALLWLFILSAVSVIRSDLFGKTVRASDQPQPQELETPPPPPRKAKRQRGQPRVFTISQGNQAGLSADLAGGVIMIGRSADCQLILDDDYVSTRHARVVGAPTASMSRISAPRMAPMSTASGSPRRPRSRLPTPYASARPC